MTLELDLQQLGSNDKIIFAMVDIGILMEGDDRFSSMELILFHANLLNFSNLFCQLIYTRVRAVLRWTAS